MSRPHSAASCRNAVRAALAQIVCRCRDCARNLLLPEFSMANTNNAVTRARIVVPAQTPILTLPRRQQIENGNFSTKFIGLCRRRSLDPEYGRVAPTLFRKCHVRDHRGIGPFRPGRTARRPCQGARGFSLSKWAMRYRRCRSLINM